MVYNYKILSRWIGIVSASIALILTYLQEEADIKSVYPQIALIIPLIIICLMVSYRKRSMTSMDDIFDVFVFGVDLFCIIVAILNNLGLVISIGIFLMIIVNYYKRIISLGLKIFYKIAIGFINLLKRKPFHGMRPSSQSAFVISLRKITDSFNMKDDKERQEDFLEACRKNPPVIYAKHLDIIKNWKGYAFNILLLEGDQIELRKEKCSDTKGKAEYDLDIYLDRDAKYNDIVKEKRKFYKEYICKYIEKEKKTSEEIASS